MKILLVTMQYGRSYTQGTERYVAALSECLRERGHEVITLAGDPLRLGPRLRLGQPVPGERELLAYPTGGWMSIRGLRPGRLADLLRQIQPDVVHLNTPAHVGAGILDACRRLRIPCVVTVHDHWWVCPKGTLLRPDGTMCDGTPEWWTCIRCLGGDHPRGWVRRLASLRLPVSPLLLKMYCLRGMFRGLSFTDMCRWLWRRHYLIGRLDEAEFVLFPSRSMASVLVPRLSHRGWRVVYNGLPEPWFDSPRAARTEILTPDRLTVGYSGSLAPHKAPHLLLEAIRRLNWTKTRVRLAGAPADPVYDARLRRQAAGLNVEFTGPLTAREMPLFLRSLDVLAMTSIWPENCPYSVLEAQAAGVTVVGSRAGGVPELLADERLLFEPGSADGLAAALEFTRQHPEVGHPARVTTAKEMTDAVEKVYRDARARVIGR